MPAFFVAGFVYCLTEKSFSNSYEESIPTFKNFNYVSTSSLKNLEIKYRHVTQQYHLKQSKVGGKRANAPLDGGLPTHGY